MGTAVRWGFAAWTISLVGACGGEEPNLDGAADVSTSDAGVVGPAIPWLDAGAPPLELTPCPEGWTAVAAGGVTTCDPRPADGSPECPFGEAHFAGEPSCTPIGDACPAGDWADSLPTDAPVVYVKADASAGGDGSRGAPYASLAEVPWLSLPAGATVALAKGSYEGTLALKPATRLVGACVAETVLIGAATPAQSVLTVQARGEPAFVSNLAIVEPPQWGVFVRDERSLVLDGILVQGAEAHGAIVGESGDLVARSLVVRATVPDDFGFNGNGVVAQTGGRFEASRLIVEANREVGVAAQSGEVVLTDAVVQATREGDNPMVDTGIGISVQEGGQLEASRVLVDDNRDVGLYLYDSEATVADMVIRGTRGRASDGMMGRGIELHGGSTLQATRLLVDDNRDVGVIAAEASVVTLVDTVIQRTGEREVDGLFGRGLELQSESRLDATRVVIDQHREVGVLIDTTDARLVDVLIRRTRGRVGSLAVGHGLATVGSSVSGTRVVVEDAKEIGILATSASTLTLDDVVVTGIAVSDSDLPDHVHGHALGAIDSRVRVTGFHLDGAATCGVLVTSETGFETGLDLATGIVEHTAIGACVQIDDYDLERLVNDVVFRDNGTNLDSTSLPVPQAPESVSTRPP